MVVLLKEKKNNTYCKNKQKKIRKLGQDAERTGPAHWPANESAECPEQIRDMFMVIPVIALILYYLI
jgi:hypothetical protein